MAHRCRIQITAHILEIALRGVNRTKIMYNTPLSYNQLKQYLEFLLATGLLEFDQNKIFKTTGKGMHFLDIYRELSKLVPQILDTMA